MVASYYVHIYKIRNIKCTSVKRFSKQIPHLLKICLLNKYLLGAKVYNLLYVSVLKLN